DVERLFAVDVDDGAADAVVEQLRERIEPERIVEEALIGLVYQLPSFDSLDLFSVDERAAAVFGDVEQHLLVVEAEAVEVALAIPQMVHAAEAPAHRAGAGPPVDADRFLDGVGERVGGGA